MKLDQEDYLAHYGILRRSGRYPWGSGKDVHTRSASFLDTVNEMKRNGMTEAEIARVYNRSDAKFTTNDLRAARTIAINEQKQHRINQIRSWQDKGLSNVAIGQKMGLNESTIRSLTASGRQEKLDILKSTADMLKQQVEKKGAIDIGTQVEKALPLSENPAQLIGISPEKFRTAVAIVKQQEGYKQHKVPVKQLGTGLDTKVLVLAKPDVKWVDMLRNPSLIQPIAAHTEDHGRTYTLTKPPLNISSRRVKVNYAEDGGAKKDGLIEIRPGAKNLDMGNSRFAQVRIAVDGSHFLKGMAVYNPDLPAGTDIRFNTNKSKKDVPKKLDAMKPMEKDPQTGKIDKERPFGAVIKPNGQRGALNIVREEHDWETWRNNLPSQMLSKQDPKLARQQLDLGYDRRRKELDAINHLTNPAIKKKLLETFGDETDSSAVHLEAAGMARQATKVLLPVPSMKPHEVYAPTLPNGTRVALIRFPHGGKFEIPELTVNNKNTEARKLLGSSAADAIGIHHKVAERLSGADFDGDHVLVIPNERGQVKSQPALKGLKDFDPSRSYPPYDGMRTIDGGVYKASTKKVEHGPKGPTKSRMQQEMGNVSNLITDMTVRGASHEEIAAAVRHSMVVIDSEKHVLDYKASEKQNNIPNLKKKYQGDPRNHPQPTRAGASTLLSRATAPTHPLHRKPRPAKDGGPIDKKTGAKVFVDSGQSYVNKQGETVQRRFKTQTLAVTPDAHTLSSGTSIERVYADHSNRLKALANESRKEMVNTKTTPVSSSAKKVYKNEVASLQAKLDNALKNAPLERQAQIYGRTVVNQKKAANPNMDNEDLKKITRQALAEGRARTGAKKHRIGSKETPLTQREWDAIQAGAISNHKLEQILNNSELETIRKYATPRQHLLMDTGKKARARTMLAKGFTQAEVADQLGVALSTLNLSLNG